MSRSRHPDKHIEAAIVYAESLGWRVEKSSARAHSWGKLLCPLTTRDGCRVLVWSTPRDCENHARHITQKVDQCEHGTIADRHQHRDDGHQPPNPV